MSEGILIGIASIIGVKTATESSSRITSPISNMKDVLKKYLFFKTWEKSVQADLNFIVILYLRNLMMNDDQVIHYVQCKSAAQAQFQYVSFFSWNIPRI